MKDEDKKIAIEVLDKMSARTVDVISALGKVFNGADNDQDYRVVNALGTDAIRQFNAITAQISKTHLEIIELQERIAKAKQKISQLDLDL